MTSSLPRRRDGCSRPALSGEAFAHELRSEMKKLEKIERRRRRRRRKKRLSGDTRRDFGQ